MRGLVVLAVLLLAALTAGCGSITAADGSPPKPAATLPAASQTPPPDPTPVPSAVADCLADLPHHDLRVPGDPPVKLRLVGSGHTAVVLSNESDLGLCSWHTEAAKLSRQGYLVGLYDYVGTPQDDLGSIVRYLRGHGVHDLILMGASKGAMTTIVAAARSDVPPVAVVSLSAETNLGPVSVDAAARRLSSPALYATAMNDRYRSAPAARKYAAHSPNSASRLIVVPGSTHGLGLLGDPVAAHAVDAFLARWMPVQH